MKLFQFALLWHPTDEQKKDGKKSELIRVGVGDVDSPGGRMITTVVADNEKTAMLLAGREIPKKYLEQIDQIEVALRPF